MIAITNHHISYYLKDYHKIILTKKKKKKSSPSVTGHFFLEILCQIFLSTEAFAKFHAINNHIHLEL